VAVDEAKVRCRLLRNERLAAGPHGLGCVVGLETALTGTARIEARGRGAGKILESEEGGTEDSESSDTASQSDHRPATHNSPSFSPTAVSRVQGSTLASNRRSDGGVLGMNPTTSPRRAEPPNMELIIYDALGGGVGP